MYINCSNGHRDLCLLQALNILENFDLKAWVITVKIYSYVYQTMNLAFADRDFYYGDPYFPPAEPMKGLLSKEYAKERAELINSDKNDPNMAPVILIRLKEKQILISIC